MKLKLSDLHDLVVRVLSSKYYSKEQAKDISEVLMYAELTGKNTQGILKLIGTEPMQNVQPKYDPKIVKESAISAYIDGGGNAAPLVCKLGSKLAIEKAEESGLSVVGIYNIFSSSGTIGYYVNEATKEGLIGIALAGSPGGVAPHGTINPLFGTNPMAFGFPTEKDPIIFDMATSAITWYGLVRAKTLGEKLPDDVAVDSEGNLTTNPEEAMKGAILPFDRGYKGSGLSMVVEILSGTLTGGTFGTPDGNGDWHNLFIVIDPDLLVGKDTFKQNNTKLVKMIKDSKRANKEQEILIPGERGLKMKKAIEDSGEIEVEDKILDQLKSLV